MLLKQYQRNWHHAIPMLSAPQCTEYWWWLSLLKGSRKLSVVGSTDESISFF